ncbi:hypothetical protein [Actinomadura sp. NPDC048394]
MDAYGDVLQVRGLSKPQGQAEGLIPTSHEVAPVATGRPDAPIGLED